jgi:hypothetical protein
MQSNVGIQPIPSQYQGMVANQPGVGIGPMKPSRFLDSQGQVADMPSTKVQKSLKPQNISYGNISEGKFKIDTNSISQGNVNTKDITKSLMQAVGSEDLSDSNVSANMKSLYEVNKDSLAKQGISSYEMFSRNPNKVKELKIPEVMVSGTINRDLVERERPGVLRSMKAKKLANEEALYNDVLTEMKPAFWDNATIQQQGITPDSVVNVNLPQEGSPAAMKIEKLAKASKESQSLPTSYRLDSPAKRKWFADEVIPSIGGKQRLLDLFLSNEATEITKQMGSSDLAERKLNAQIDQFGKEMELDWAKLGLEKRKAEIAGTLQQLAYAKSLKDLQTGEADSTEEQVAMFGKMMNDRYKVIEEGIPKSTRDPKRSARLLEQTLSKDKSYQSYKTLHENALTKMTGIKVEATDTKKPGIFESIGKGVWSFLFGSNQKPNEGGMSITTQAQRQQEKIKKQQEAKKQQESELALTQEEDKVFKQLYGENN